MVFGQDGSYLAEFLQKKLYRSWPQRKSSSFNTEE